MDRFLSVYKATIASFKSSMMYYMPSGSYRDFHGWAISSDNPQYSTWQQIVGIPQFAKLTETLLGDLVPEKEKWTDLLPYTAWMNTYLIYETISDNLAIGLAQKQQTDSTYFQRKQILLNFNKAMVARLGGEVEQCQVLLKEIEADARSISSFKQSLTEQEQLDIAGEYLSKTGSDNLKNIEYDTWSPLVGNIEAGIFVANLLDTHTLGSYFRDGLIWRYESVNKLLSRKQLRLEELQAISTHSILVIPVLTYYISVLAELIYPNTAIQDVLDSQILQKTLEDAALMVRLTNDLGTNLVASREYVSSLFNELYQKSQTQPPEMLLTTFLLNMASSDVNLTRIQKDIEYGEYNISLSDLMHVPLSLQNLLVFGTNVAYFNQCYQQCRSRLNKNLSKLTDALDDDRISQLIKRFVDFHEQIYSFRFDDQAGDYATKPDQKLA